MMVVALRLAPQTFAKLSTALDRLCAQEERTWKERLLNPTQADEVTSSQRNGAASWLRKVSNSMQFSLDTYALSVDLLDRFLSTLKVRPKFLECLAVGCLYVAAKYKEEDEKIAITPEFVIDCNSSCSASELLRMERVILEKFHWSADFVTSSDFLQLFFALLLLNLADGEEESILLEKYRTLEIQLSSSLQHHRLSSFKPRVLALALISLEFDRQPLGLNVDWLLSISYLQRLAKIENDQLVTCRDLLVRSLSTYKAVRLELSDLKFISHLSEPLISFIHSSDRPSYADVLRGRQANAGD